MEDPNAEELLPSKSIMIFEERESDPQPRMTPILESGIGLRTLATLHGHLTHPQAILELFVRR